MPQDYELTRRTLLRLAGASPALAAGLAIHSDVHAAERGEGRAADVTGLKIHPYDGRLMHGFPPNASDIVTIDNLYEDRQHLRWFLQHGRELMPTQCLSRGTGPVSEFERMPISVEKFNELALTPIGNERTTVRQFLEEQHADAFVVLHRGRLVTEQYFGGMTPATPHALFSLGKSLTATMLRTLLGKQLREEDRIEKYVPELGETAYAGAKIRDLLDMRSGIAYAYTVEGESELGRHMDLTRATAKRESPEGAWNFLLSLRRERPHGQSMKYKESDVAAVVLAAERVTNTRFADLFSQTIWSRLGTEHDAYVRCDAWGEAVPSFGISATARDIARWGQMCLQDGQFNGQQVVPAGLVKDIFSGRFQKIDVKNLGDSDIDQEMPAGTAYRGFFWLPGGQTDAFLANGGLGQICYVNTKFQTVIVGFASYMPGDDFTRLIHAQWKACEQISQLVSGLFA